ncbi:hypothetical protein [Pedosphaera parvula]|uniref:ABM domain-containing protein n=1 Tax=Pedosphaera parvula (strain Ellin514) TaxID=320771 RepID=B9XDC6_PEDPL|nr:hypothetical protein [Pedosphaera parvula]EEF62072.1 conserved hypothetical protein [Pedosphaera parvula Ellin514]
MYAAIRRYETNSPAELTRLINESFVPRISEIKGFEAYYCIDAGEGMIASTSVFDSEEGAGLSNLMAEDWIAQNAAKLITGQFRTVAGNVIAHQVAAHQAA